MTERKPYILYNVSVEKDMLESQCVFCEKYDISRPTCKILSNLYDGRYSRDFSPSKWYLELGIPRCEDLIRTGKKELPELQPQTQEGKVPEYLVTRDTRLLNTIMKEYR